MHAVLSAPTHSWTGSCWLWLWASLDGRPSDHPHCLCSRTQGGLFASSVLPSPSWPFLSPQPWLTSPPALSSLLLAHFLNLHLIRCPAPSIPSSPACFSPFSPATSLPQDISSRLLPMLPVGPVGRDESWCLGAVIHRCWRGSLPPWHKLCPEHWAWAGESCTHLSGGDGADGSHAHALERVVWSGVSVRTACVRTCQSKC